MRAILLDLDDTLVDDHHATACGFRAFVAAHRDRLHGERERALLARWRAVQQDVWVRHERGELSFLEQRRLRVRAFLGEELSDATVDDAFLPYLHAYAQAWRLLPGVRRFLKRSAAIPKVILTNGHREQQLRKVAATGLLPHVVAVVTPQDCGSWKPQPEMFLHGARLLNVAPGECFMFGDDPVRDIEPGLRLGMACFRVERGRCSEAFERALSAV
jgi:putative hydrolase of the HAD superfamily